jgi:GTPase involved in cell partitioning and DNA repair
MSGNRIFPDPCGGGGGHCGTNWPTEVVEIATLMNLMKMTFLHISPEKGQKGWLKKMPAGRIRQDKSLRISCFLSFYNLVTFL